MHSFWFCNKKSSRILYSDRRQPDRPESSGYISGIFCRDDRRAIMAAGWEKQQYRTLLCLELFVVAKIPDSRTNYIHCTQDMCTGRPYWTLAVKCWKLAQDQSVTDDSWEPSLWFLNDQLHVKPLARTWLIYNERSVSSTFPFSIRLIVRHDCKNQAQWATRQ